MYCHRGQEPANARDNTVSKSLFLTGSFSTTVTNHFISKFILQNVLWSRERLSLHRRVLVEAVCRLHRGQPRMRHARLFCRTLSISHTNSFRRKRRRYAHTCPANPSRRYSIEFRHRGNPLSEVPLPYSNLLLQLQHEAKNTTPFYIASLRLGQIGNRLDRAGLQRLARLGQLSFCGSIPQVLLVFSPLRLRTVTPYGCPVKQSKTKSRWSGIVDTISYLKYILCV